MTEVAGAKPPRRPIQPVEPVHWGARLVRAPGVVYTEVAGTPVLVRSDDAELQPLPPAWAGCWAALDGRSVAEALEVDVSTIDPITSRNVIEVLRRLKAERLIVDLESLDSDDRTHALADDPTDQPDAGPVDITVHGHLEHAAGRAMLTIAPPPGLRRSEPTDDRFDDLLTLHLVEVDGARAPSAQGEPVDVEFAAASIRRAGTPPHPTSDTSAEPEFVERSIIALASLLAALDDPSCLAESGVVDRLAALAEQTHPTS